MFKYLEFLNNTHLELIDESILYFSPNLRKNLKKLNNDMSNMLLNLEGTDLKPDITFVDIDKDGYLSFVTMRNATNMIKAKYPHLYEPDSRGLDVTPNISLADVVWNDDINNTTGITTKSRNTIKIGKFVNKVLPDKYTEKQVEDFVNQMKASIENIKEKFKIIEGDDIISSYNYLNYFDQSGSLGSSCMKNKSNLFKIYTENKNTCRLVVLLEDGKVKGRALLWKVSILNEEYKDLFEYFLDRQYTNNESDVVKFRNYAKENKWGFKSYNNHHDYQSVSFELDSSTNNYTLRMSAKASKPSDDRYPYMDTFRRYDPRNETLYNDNDDNPKNKEQYLLSGTDGDYDVISSDIWSDHFDERIPEEDALYSEPMQDWIWRNSAVEVKRGNSHNKGWYPEDHRYVVYSKYKDEYLHRDDCVYSEFMGTYLFESDSISVVSRVTSSYWCNIDAYNVPIDCSEYIDFDKVEELDWYKCARQKNRNWNIHSGILASLLNEDLTPSILSIEVYKDKNTQDFFSEVDSIILEKEVEGNPISIDVSKYDMELKRKNILREILEKAMILIKSEKPLSLSLSSSIDIRIVQIETEKNIYKN